MSKKQAKWSELTEREKTLINALCKCATLRPASPREADSHDTLLVIKETCMDTLASVGVTIFNKKEIESFFPNRRKS